jgi:hypothetical protein
MSDLAIYHQLMVYDMPLAVIGGQLCLIIQRAAREVLAASL